MAASFRRKVFSYVVEDTIKGASIGASLSTLALPFLRNSVGRDEYNKIKAISMGTLFGAALGAIIGLIRDGENYSRKSTVDSRLMSFVLKGLKDLGFKEGVHFVRDPKKATDLKTRVCIVITKVSGEFNLLVNTISDHKLSELTKEMIKNLPNSSTVTEKVSDKFNDITISSISDSSASASLVTSICERFIRAGFPIYLVEVG